MKHLEEVIINYDKKLMEANKEIERLKERVEYLERSNNRREDEILELRKENADLDNIIKEVREYIENNSYFEGNAIKTMIYQDYSIGILEILDKENR